MRSWRISDLKEHLRCNLDIPEYEQHFEHKSTRLRSDDLLCNLERGGENRLDLTLVRESIPKQFPHSRTKRIWNAFVAFSSDFGDSIDGMKATHVAQFANMYQVAQILASSTNLPNTLTFGEVLDLFASLVSPSQMKTEATLPQDEVLVPVLHLNLGDVRFARARAVEQWSADSLTEDFETLSEFGSDSGDDTDASV
eukprot:TRINITY_DN17161_c0_g1_i1.p2 TRINITY_DN17161_c0_g1~~TRINITY_DN17161_c0_g1_i1.p2  ORF type:complete len:215 (-),score=27.69 TRINITY_DN17161_c0_g1_i1:213-803(-)